MSNTFDSNKLTLPEEKKDLLNTPLAKKLGEGAAPRMASAMRKTLASMRYSLYRMRGGASR